MKKEKKTKKKKVIENVVTKEIAEKPKKKKEEKIVMPVVKSSKEEDDEDEKAPSKADLVSQYTMDGKYIRTFPSINDAVAAMEISRQTILDYINGKRYQTGGYLWGYDTETLAGKRIGR